MNTTGGRGNSTTTIDPATLAAEDSLLAGSEPGRLAVWYVGRVPGLDWLTQVSVKLPDEFVGPGTCA